ARGTHLRAGVSSRAGRARAREGHWRSGAPGRGGRASEAEVLGPPGAALVEVGADAQGAVVAVEYVRFVTRAVHPGVHHGARVGRAPRYVLAAEVRYPAVLRPVPGAEAVRGGV